MLSVIRARLVAALTMLVAVVSYNARVLRDVPEIEVDGFFERVKLRYNEFDWTLNRR